MTESRPRFCPRCGAEAVGGMPFCPNCGLDMTAGGPSRTATEPGAAKELVAPREPVTAKEPVTPREPVTPKESVTPKEPVTLKSPRATERSSRFPPVVFAGLLVMVGLLGYGFLTRPVAPPASGAPGLSGAAATASASVLASAPIVGLTILSPTDGQAVATKDVNVIGTAPPGVGVTRDVSFGLDEHTTSDGTGHWAMRVGLKEGENKLVFRIGDDQSTRREIRVTYTPPSGG
jgi:hypothetical protein